METLEICVDLFYYSDLQKNYLILLHFHLILNHTEEKNL